MDGARFPHGRMETQRQEEPFCLQSLSSWELEMGLWTLTSVLYSGHQGSQTPVAKGRKNALFQSHGPGPGGQVPQEPRRGRTS